MRAGARERAWAAGVGPRHHRRAGDVDATITIAHSEKENAANTWKKTFGFHLLLAYLDRPDVSGGEALAGLPRPGKVRSNTAADHVEILTLALAVLPDYARPRPGDPNSPQVQIRTDSAGATHTFAAAPRTAGRGFSLGFLINPDTQNAVLAIPDQAWFPAYNIDGDYRVVLATENGPRRGLQVTVHRDGGRAPLVARWGGISLARDTTPTVLNDDPPRIWSNRRSELVQRLLADTCELCGSSNQVEVHHIRALKDLNPAGRKQQPEWATRMAARRRKTLLVCRACHESIHYHGCSTRQPR